MELEKSEKPTKSGNLPAPPSCGWNMKHDATMTVRAWHHMVHMEWNLIEPFCIVWPPRAGVHWKLLVSDHWELGLFFATETSWSFKWCLQHCKGARQRCRDIWLRSGREAYESHFRLDWRQNFEVQTKIPKVQKCRFVVFCLSSGDLSTLWLPPGMFQVIRFSKWLEMLWTWTLKLN